MATWRRRGVAYPFGFLEGQLRRGEQLSLPTPFGF